MVKSIKVLLAILVLFLGLTHESSLLKAETNHASKKTRLIIAAEHQLNIDKTRNELLQTKLLSLQVEKQKIPTQVSIDSNSLRQAELTISLAQADVDGIALTLNAAQQAVDLTQNNIENLENQAKDLITLFHASRQQQEQLQQQMKNQKLLLALQQDRVRVLQQTQSLATRTLAIVQDWKVQLQAKYQLQQRQSRQQALDNLAAGIQSEQQKWLSRISVLNEQLQELSTSGSNSRAYASIEMAIFEAEERSNLSQVQLDLARLHVRFEDLSATSPTQLISVSNLNTIQRQLETLSGQIKDISKVLQQKIELLQKRIKILIKSSQVGTLAAMETHTNLNSLYRLQSNYEELLEEAVSLQVQVNHYQTQVADELSKQLACRQGLPGFNCQEWLLLGEKVLQIPALTWQTFHGLQKSFFTALRNAESLQWFLWGLALITWGFITVKVGKYLNLYIPRLEARQPQVLTTSAFVLCLKLVRQHLPGIAILTGFIGLLLFMGLSLHLFSLMIDLGLVILGFRMSISLARLSFLESLTHKEGTDVKLYRRLKWVLRIGGMLTVLTVLGSCLPLPHDVQNLFGRLFMLFLLVISLVLLKGWEVVPTLLQPYLAGKQAYLRQVVRFLSLLIPISILSNSIIGLLGYVELAWNIGIYQSIFIIVITSYLIARGILAEVMKFFSEQVIRWSRHGWLWSEAVLKPMHQVLKIILFIEALIVLFKLYGWGSHSFVVTKLGEMLGFHLFDLGGSAITPWNIMVLLAIIAVLVWAARWTREFAYRWLFVNTNDLGLRNSLAIFTQYTVIAVGILIALRIAGINLTALTVVASAFAFGVGLGLRDLANNFMCGILLLIERPVRVGDLVTIGNLDGQIMHIGIRSITVTTDDHKELLVPNADVFGKTFMNWTHRDTIVRTLFVLHVNRTDDPRRVKELIIQELSAIPEILKSPPPAVYFKKMENMLLEFEIEYFLDLKQTRSRLEMHSKVLFKLWDRFAKEGIQPPHYPHEILLQQAE